MCAADITVDNAVFVSVNDEYQLDADLSIDFHDEIKDAVNKGVALYFLVEFSLMQPKSYWFDKKITSARQTIRLSYHALSRQYLVNTAARQVTFSTLEEALVELGHIRHWAVINKSILGDVLSCYAKLRMRLDHSRLPKPLQVNAIGSDHWQLISDRYRWTPVFDKSGVDKFAKPIVIDRSISDQ